MCGVPGVPLMLRSMRMVNLGLDPEMGYEFLVTAHQKDPLKFGKEMLDQETRYLEMLAAWKGGGQKVEAEEALAPPGEQEKAVVRRIDQLIAEIKGRTD